MSDCLQSNEDSIVSVWPQRDSLVGNSSCCFLSYFTFHLLSFSSPLPVIQGNNVMSLRQWNTCNYSCPEDGNLISLQCSVWWHGSNIWQYRNSWAGTHWKWKCPTQLSHFPLVTTVRKTNIMKYCSSTGLLSWPSLSINIPARNSAGLLLTNLSPVFFIMPCILLNKLFLLFGIFTAVDCFIPRPRVPTCSARRLSARLDFGHFYSKQLARRWRRGSRTNLGQHQYLLISPPPTHGSQFITRNSPTGLGI